MRQLLIIVLSFGLSVGLVIAADVENDEADDSTVPPNLRLTVSEDLQSLGSLSRDKAVPILLMFSTEDCDYCKRLEAEVLGPLRLAGVDPQRVILRKVFMDEYTTLRDFSGHKRNAEKFAATRGIRVAPTLQLVNAAGEELVPKIVGYQTPGLYDDYLEKKKRYRFPKIYWSRGNLFLLGCAFTMLIVIVY